MTVVSSAPSTEAATAGPAGPAVRVDGVVKRFGRGPVVLDGVSLDVAPGEFVCLLGASGCGKSTLLSLLAGLDAPTAGSLAAPGGRTALMFQEPALLPWLTASRNVELAVRLAGRPSFLTRARGWLNPVRALRSSRAAAAHRRSEALRLLTLVRLDQAADKRPHELSGGMRQRVALARALAQSPAVLLMDEPFAALDAITRDVLHEELSRLWRETGLTVVFVTHNVREAVRLGQRVLLMSSKPGRIVEEYPVRIDGDRRIEDPDVAELSALITDRLREEIRRHG